MRSERLSLPSVSNPLCLSRFTFLPRLSLQRCLRVAWLVLALVYAASDLSAEILLAQAASDPRLVSRADWAVWLFPFDHRIRAIRFTLRVEAQNALDSGKLRQKAQ